MDIVRFSIDQPDGQCEFLKHGFTHIPAMVYIDAKGKQVATTDELLQKSDLELRLNDLLAGKPLPPQPTH